MRVGWFGRTALKHVYYHMWNKLPVRVLYMIQGAQGWCTGKTQRDGMGREGERGFRMGNTCTPMAVSCQCMAKAIQYCKIINLKGKKKTNPPQCSLQHYLKQAGHGNNLNIHQEEWIKKMWIKKIHTYNVKLLSTIQFSHSVMSDSLRPHGMQHAGLPCPSPTPWA